MLQHRSGFRGAMDKALSLPRGSSLQFHKAPHYHAQGGRAHLMAQMPLPRCSSGTDRKDSSASMAFVAV